MDDNINNLLISFYQCCGSRYGLFGSPGSGSGFCKKPDPDFKCLNQVRNGITILFTQKLGISKYDMDPDPKKRDL